MVDFIAWVAGKNPRLQTIFASYSDKLGERANSELQRIFDSEAYQRIFWCTKIPALANVTSEMRYKRNSELLEFVDNAPGSFRNTTVNGQITGFSLDLGVIDDPMKGRAEEPEPFLAQRRLSSNRPRTERAIARSCRGCLISSTGIIRNPRNGPRMNADHRQP